MSRVLVATLCCSSCGVSLLVGNPQPILIYYNTPNTHTSCFCGSTLLLIQREVGSIGGLVCIFPGFLKSRRHGRRHGDGRTVAFVRQSQIINNFYHCRLGNHGRC